MSVPEVWATGKNLPPGLWLPTAEEPTEKYLARNYFRTERPYHDIIDYGAFIVALAAYDQDDTQRTSLMPSYIDVEEMHDAGYGVSLQTLQNKYGGLARLQQELGFYNRASRPAAPEVLERFKWIARHAYQLDPLPENPREIKEIMEWGAARNLTPASKIVYKLLDGDTTVLRKIFNLEWCNTGNQYTRLDLYKFGAEVLRDHGRPLTEEELNAKYSGRFVSSPKATIRQVFGNMTRFWLEFERLPKRPDRLSPQSILKFGVNRAISIGKVDLNRRVIDDLSGQQAFPSRATINEQFGGIAQYRQLVNNDYERYLQLQADFTTQGVSESVFRLACRNFEATESFENRLRHNAVLLRKLSAGGQASFFVLHMIKDGFNLLDEKQLDRQVDYYRWSLRRLGVKKPRDIQVAFELVPRFDAEEAMTSTKKAA